MTTPHDTIHEAIRVVAASVSNPDETVPASTVALGAAKRLGNGAGDDWHGWQALALGLLNLSQILLADRVERDGEAPLDVLRRYGARFPRG